MIVLSWIKWNQLGEASLGQHLSVNSCVSTMAPATQTQKTKSIKVVVGHGVVGQGTKGRKHISLCCGPTSHAPCDPMTQGPSSLNKEEHSRHHGPAGVWLLGGAGKGGAGQTFNFCINSGFERKNMYFDKFLLSW